MRNPANAPDVAERRALERFAARWQQPGPPEHLLETQATPRGTVYRYYRPIKVVGFCLRCHGPTERLSPAVTTVLGKRYPQDRATGYQSGDFRGIFSVTIPEGALR